jgi:O-antigen ligase
VSLIAQSPPEPAAGTSAAVASSSEALGSLTAFRLVLLYTVFEYGRPQDLIPGISKLKLPTLVTLFLFFQILSTRAPRPKSGQVALFGLMLGFIVAWIPVAPNNYWAFITGQMMFFYFVVFLGLITFVHSPERFNYLTRFWIGVHVFLCIYGIKNLGKGIGGFMGDENDFCMTINMAVPYVFFGLFAAETAKERNRLLFVLFLFLATCVITKSRGGFIGLVAVGAYCWAMSPRRILGLVLIALLVGGLSLVAPEDYAKEIRSIFEEGAETGTGEERVFTWRYGWRLFVDHPLFGVGPGNFAWAGGDRYEELLDFHGRSMAGRAAHSLYYTLLPELGVVGLVIFACMTIGVLRATRAVCGRCRSVMSGGWPDAEVRQARRYRCMALAMEGSLIGFLISSIFISTLYYPNFWYLVGFSIALRRVVEERYAARPHPQ